jgi:DNA-binding transcriptional MocR family regulator
VQQVRRGASARLSASGDQLPTVKDAVSHLAISPNTVVKAYRQLENEGLVSAPPGQGTFITDAVRDGRSRPVREAAPTDSGTSSSSRRRWSSASPPPLLGIAIWHLHHRITRPEHRSDGASDNSRCARYVAYGRREARCLCPLN